MKLVRLNIVNYRLFKNLNIDFDKNDVVTTIIGRNGSGKTTLIECLTRIFSDLLKCETVDDFKSIETPFDFSVTYLLRKENSLETIFEETAYKNYIGIEIAKNNGEVTLILYEGDRVYDKWEDIVKQTREAGSGLKYLLPDNFVVYYSGIAEVILAIYREFQKTIILGSLDGDVKIEQPFYYFIPENLEPIIISLLLFEFGDIPEKLKIKFGIEGFRSVSIIFKKPKWAKSKSLSETFWGAKGGLQVFLSTLKESANTTKLENNTIEFIFSSRQNLDKVREYYRTEKRVFEYLVALQANDLVESINVTLLKGGLDLNCQRLSEGEKQLLIINGLKELLAAENTLFLLDEPDTYLHPEWKRAFIHDIIKEDDRFKNSIIVTSHSPNIISGMKRGQLKILKNERGIADLKQFTINPYGKPVDQLLIDFFGVEGLRYIKVEDDLNTLWELLKNEKYSDSAFTELFQKLEKEIGKDDPKLTSLKIEIIKRTNANAKNKEG